MDDSISRGACTAAVPGMKFKDQSSTFSRSPCLFVQAGPVGKAVMAPARRLHLVLAADH